MAYPNQPNFGIAANDSAWWKIRNPRASQQFVCSTNGAGFVSALKQYLVTFLQGTSPVLWGAPIAKPDFSGWTMANAESISNTSRWSEGTVSALAAWFRSATGGEARAAVEWTGSGLPPTPIPADAADRTVAGMEPWARALHGQLREEFRTQRIGFATLSIAAWCVTYHRDLASGMRLGGAGAGTVGQQLTPFSDITLQSNAVAPAWDTDLPRPAQGISCASVTDRVPVGTGGAGAGAGGAGWMDQIRGAFDFSGLQQNDWMKLGLIALGGGVVGHQVIGKMKPRRRRRK